MADTKEEAKEHEDQERGRKGKYSNEPRWFYHKEHGARLCEDGQPPPGTGWLNSPATFGKDWKANP